MVYCVSAIRSVGGRKEVETTKYATKRESEVAFQRMLESVGGTYEVYRTSPMPRGFGKLAAFKDKHITIRLFQAFYSKL